MSRTNISGIVEHADSDRRWSIVTRVRHRQNNDMAEVRRSSGFKCFQHAKHEMCLVREVDFVLDLLLNFLDQLSNFRTLGVFLTLILPFRQLVAVQVEDKQHNIIRQGHILWMR